MPYDLAEGGSLAEGDIAKFELTPRVPDGCTFNGKRNILPEAYFNTLTLGAVLNNEAQNPLVWHNTWVN